MAETKIRACPVCGSVRLGWVGGGANSIYDSLGVSSLSGMDACQNCGRKVFPIEFDNEKKYREFVSYLKERKAGGKGAGEAESPSEGKGGAENAETANDKAVLEEEPEPSRGIFRIDILIFGVALVLVPLISFQYAPVTSVLIMLAGLCLIVWSFKKKKEIA